MKLTLNLLFSQGALHAANAELTAIAAEKDILVKHLDKCQVCSTYEQVGIKYLGIN